MYSGAMYAGVPSVARRHRQLRFDARGDAEIHHPRHAIVVDQDVARLEITVDDPGCMRVRDRIEDGAS
jgi:hypothetical protein